MSRRLLIAVLFFGTLLTGCSTLRATSYSPSDPDAKKTDNYNCTADKLACIALPIRVSIGFDKALNRNVCTIAFTFHDYYLPRGRDATWMLMPLSTGMFRFKEVRDGGRLTLAGIHIQGLSESPDFENGRYGATQDIYVWTSTRETRKQRHRYTINVEWRQSAGDKWQDCPADDPIVVNSF